MSSPPLEGIKVLDMARYIAGPFCSMMLGDMGADVVKVERPGGEDTRHLQPSRDGHSVYTMLYNRNKRAITINPRSDRGRELLVELAKWADVVVENYRPGTMEKMGLGYEQLHEINPRVILTSISGFGQTGPLRDRALFDAIGQAMAGVMSLTGSPDGPPTMTGTYTADHTTGLYAALGTVLALRERDRTGEGQHVDVALLDAMYSAIGVAASAYLNTGEVMGRTGNRDSLAAPGNTFRDGRRVDLSRRQRRCAIQAADAGHRPARTDRRPSVLRKALPDSKTPRSSRRSSRHGRGISPATRSASSCSRPAFRMGRWPTWPKPPRVLSCSLAT